MKDDRKEFFDTLPEEEILKYLPEELPPMEDEPAAKRIENRVLEEMKIQQNFEKRSLRRQKQKKAIAAVVCCLAVLGALGREPIMAAFQRLFYDLPGVGVYIDETETEIHEVQIDNPVQEKDGVRVELKNFYCKEGQILGEIEFTGEELLAIADSTDTEQDDILKEKFQLTWYYGDKSGALIGSGEGWSWEDGKIIRYTRDCEEYLRLDEGYDTYQIGIKGFDERFTLKIADPKVVENVEDLGYTVTKNDTSVTARAMVENGEIHLEYFIIPSAEVKTANEGFMEEFPYHFDFENAIYIENAKGERLKGKYEEMGNGGKYILEGGKKDFPLTLHFNPFTGTDEETQQLTLPLPKNGGKLTENLPKAEFHYGTVEILSVGRTDEIWEDPNLYSDRTEEATKVTVRYRVVPREGQRQMYDVYMNAAEEREKENFLEGGYSGEELEDYWQTEREFVFKRMDAESLEFTLENPSYWIEGDYDVIIEKPTNVK